MGLAGLGVVTANQARRITKRPARISQGWWYQAAVAMMTHPARRRSSFARVIYRFTKRPLLVSAYFSRFVKDEDTGDDQGRYYRDEQRRKQLAFPEEIEHHEPGGPVGQELCRVDLMVGFFVGGTLI
jgi:hypothetical protein